MLAIMYALQQMHSEKMKLQPQCYCIVSESSRCSVLALAKGHACVDAENDCEISRSLEFFLLLVEVI